MLEYNERVDRWLNRVAMLCSLVGVVLLSYWLIKSLGAMLVTVVMAQTPSVLPSSLVLQSQDGRFRLELGEASIGTFGIRMYDTAQPPAQSSLARFDVQLRQSGAMHVWVRAAAPGTQMVQIQASGARKPAGDAYICLWRQPGDGHTVTLSTEHLSVREAGRSTTGYTLSADGLRQSD